MVSMMQNHLEHYRGDLKGYEPDIVSCFHQLYMHTLVKKDNVGRHLFLQVICGYLRSNAWYNANNSCERAWHMDEELDDVIILHQ